MWDWVERYGELIVSGLDLVAFLLVTPELVRIVRPVLKGDDCLYICLFTWVRLAPGGDLRNRVPRFFGGIEDDTWLPCVNRSWRRPSCRDDHLFQLRKGKKIIHKVDRASLETHALSSLKTHALYWYMSHYHRSYYCIRNVGP